MEIFAFVLHNRSVCVLSYVQLFVTPRIVGCQAPLSMGFSRQEYWNGLPFPSPVRESEVIQSCLTPSDPMDCSLQGSSVHGIFQARVLEWGAIAFSVNKVQYPVIKNKPPKLDLNTELCFDRWSENVVDC